MLHPFCGLCVPGSCPDMFSDPWLCVKRVVLACCELQPDNCCGWTDGFCLLIVWLELDLVTCLGVKSGRRTATEGGLDSSRLLVEVLTYCGSGAAFRM